MDWLRRNWPDLLIGVALIAVIAGIVTTLLTGGSLVPGGGSTPATAPPADADVAVVPDDDVEAPAPAEAEGDPAPTDADGDALAAEADAPARVEPVDPGAGLDAPATPPGAPDADVEEADAAPAEADPGAETPAAPAAPAESAEPAEAAAAAPPTDVDLAADGADAPYRVAVGTFGGRENAEALASTFRADGYPVFLGTQDDLVVVLVGPYADADRADAVAATIRAGDYGIEPLVYLFEPDATPAADAAPAPAPTPDPAPEAEAAPAPASGDARTLQLGAFENDDSAAPLLDELRALGLAPGVVREDGLVKVVVGPLEGAALEDARTLLDGAGLEYFNR